MIINQSDLLYARKKQQNMRIKMHKKEQQNMRDKSEKICTKHKFSWKYAWTARRCRGQPPDFDPPSMLLGVRWQEFRGKKLPPLASDIQHPRAVNYYPSHRLLFQTSVWKLFQVTFQTQRSISTGTFEKYPTYPKLLSVHQLLLVALLRVGYMEWKIWLNHIAYLK